MKKLVSVICVCLILFSANGSVHADSVMHSSLQNLTNGTKVMYEIQTRSEAKEWRYRFVNHKSQKRLWSITYQKWLTDWEWN